MANIRTAIQSVLAKSTAHSYPILVGRQTVSLFLRRQMTQFLCMNLVFLPPPPPPALKADYHRIFVHEFARHAQIKSTPYKSDQLSPSRNNITASKLACSHTLRANGGGRPPTLMLLVVLALEIALDDEDEDGGFEEGFKTVMDDIRRWGWALTCESGSDWELGSISRRKDSSNVFSWLMSLPEIPRDKHVLIYLDIYAEASWPLTMFGVVDQTFLVFFPFFFFLVSRGSHGSDGSGLVAVVI